MTFLDFPRQSGYRMEMRWANVQAIDVKFSHDLKHQKIIQIGYFLTVLFEK